MASRFVFAETTDTSSRSCCDLREKLNSLSALCGGQKLTLVAIEEFLQNLGVVGIAAFEAREKFSGRGYCRKPHVKAAVSFITGFWHTTRRSSSRADPQSLPALNRSANLER